MSRHLAVLLHVANGTPRLQAVTEAIEVANKLRLPTCFFFSHLPDAFTVYPGTNPYKVDKELHNLLETLSQCPDSSSETSATT